jgi:hypothetical protein
MPSTVPVKQGGKLDGTSPPEAAEFAFGRTAQARRFGRLAGRRSHSVNADLVREAAFIKNFLLTPKIWRL